MRAVWCMVLAGCIDRPVLDAPGPVMVGSTLGGSVFLKKCVDSLDEGYQSCTTTYLPIDSLSVADPSVFEVTKVEGGPGFRYTALAPGTTTLTAVAEGDTYERTVVAAEPDEVRVGGVCSGVPYGTDVEIVARFELYVDETWIFHASDTNPLTATFLLPVPRDSTDRHGEVRFRTPLTAGTGTITSPFDASLEIPVTVVGPSAVISISIGDAGYTYNTPVPLGGHIAVRGTSLTTQSLPIIGICEERFARTLRTLTPTTCAFWRDMQNHTTLAVNGPDGFELSGLAAGNCTIEATLDGTSTTTTRTFVVAP